jgi:hypothetical protein
MRFQFQFVTVVSSCGGREGHQPQAIEARSFSLARAIKNKAWAVNIIVLNLIAVIWAVGCDVMTDYQTPDRDA